MTRSATGPTHRRPSRQRGWVRTHKIPAALLSALVLGLAVGIILAVSSRSETTTTSATTHRAGPTFILPETTAVTKGGKWLTGSSGKLLVAVNADIGKLNTAERAGHQGTAKIVGAQLVTDARAALDGPLPPVDAKVYRSALDDLMRAGTFAADGDLSKVAHPLNVGLIGLAEVTAAADQPPAHNSRTSANEGSGQ